mmetsp:Transcript_10019/g.11402  ORF Transcript_10019/g.11402 Transcript_10019/m.11402 type:complete len:109 (-) Transcript_10019:352-678(-)
MNNIKKKLPYLKQKSAFSINEKDDERKDYYRPETILEIYKAVRIEVKIWLLTQKSKIRNLRLKVLKDEGMTEYIVKIKDQLMMEHELEVKTIEYIFSSLNHTPGQFLK